MIHVDENNFPFYESLEEIKEEYTPIPVFSLLQFFTLSGKTTNLVKANLIPLQCKYVVLGTDKRYYLKEYRGYDVDCLFFYRSSLYFSGDDPVVEQLRRYVYDDRTWILFTPEMISDTQKMLDRVFKANVNGTGKLTYRLFMEILEASLKYEDYLDYGKNHVGFKTACKIQEDYINNLFKKTLKN